MSVFLRRGLLLFVVLLAASLHARGRSPALAMTSTPTATSTQTPTPTDVPSVTEETRLEGDALRLIDPANPERRAFKFRTAKDPALTANPASDPTLVGALIEVEGLGTGDGDSGRISLPAENWIGLGDPPGARGYRYVDRDLLAPISRVFLKPVSAGGRLTIAGRGNGWPYSVTQPQTAVIIRMQIGTQLYCAYFPAANLAINEVGRVVGRGAAAPPSCTPPVCGNGIAEVGEECDDGNINSSDGCTVGCELENLGALCAGVQTTAGTNIVAERIASGLTLPTTITAPPLDPRRVFVTRQGGRIHVLRDGLLLATPFLDISSLVSAGLERGLLGLAFHPDYENNGRFFVNYTNVNGDTVIARYEVNPSNPDDADETSAKTLLTIAQPFANHNGGQLAFGPDGYLYVGMGDGGSGCDPIGAGQSDTTVLGKMLRIDVNVDTPPYYAVPPTNPNPGAGAPLGLIWSKGLRNPWRFSFDRGTGNLYIADVGQNAIEEINIQPATSTGGENYGWKHWEGSLCNPCGTNPTCNATGMTFPVHEYNHAAGACSITGGYVYRGCRQPDLHGRYFYADWCAGFVRTFVFSGGTAQNHQDVTAALESGGWNINNPTAFGQDARGELYIADYDGEIFRIVPQ